MLIINSKETSIRTLTIIIILSQVVYLLFPTIGIPLKGVSSYRYLRERERGTQTSDGNKPIMLFYYYYFYFFNNCWPTGAYLDYLKLQLPLPPAPRYHIFLIIYVLQLDCNLYIYIYPAKKEPPKPQRIFYLARKRVGWIGREREWGEGRERKRDRLGQVQTRNGHRKFLIWKERRSQREIGQVRIGLVNVFGIQKSQQGLAQQLGNNINTDHNFISLNYAKKHMHTLMFPQFFQIQQLFFF